MRAEQQEIECAICRRANSDFEALNQKINQAKTPAEKAPFAKQIIQQVEAILNEHQVSGNVLTDVCRTILNTRKQVAELILKFRR